MKSTLMALILNAPLLCCNLRPLCSSNYQKHVTRWEPSAASRRVIFMKWIQFPPELQIKATALAKKWELLRVFIVSLRVFSSRANYPAIILRLGWVDWKEDELTKEDMQADSLFRMKRMNLQVLHKTSRTTYTLPLKKLWSVRFILETTTFIIWQKSSMSNKCCVSNFSFMIVF